MSRLLCRTLRAAPAYAESKNYELMLRAGLVKRISSGVFSYSPLMWRAIRKMQNILEQEMDAIGGQEISLPVVQPAELWQETGRYEDLGSELVRFKDRAGRNMILAMTHEEAVTDLVRSQEVSHRQLPLMLYQVQTKFRDEPRSRGGLVRVREFLMKDAYSFHETPHDLDDYYDQVAAAYKRFFKRIDLTVSKVASDVGMMGGAEAHEYQFLSEIGEDRLVLCSSCGYSANIDTARHTLPVVTTPSPTSPLEVHTPDCTDILSLALSLDHKPEQILKTLAYYTLGEIILVCLRGDTELNIGKLAKLVSDPDIRMATEDELLSNGLVPGYLSPFGTNHKTFIDVAAHQEGSLVTGANRVDYHIKYQNPLSLSHAVVVELSLPTQESLCVKCKGALRHALGVEVGNIFKLGTKYSKSMGATFLNSQGNAEHLVMGCYGIGLGRTIACVLEQHHDERGLLWPASLAPYAVHLLVIGKEETTVEAAEAIYQDLLHHGVDVLYDDRNQSPGTKFCDADLLGMPTQVVVSRRSLQAGGAEVRLRTGGESSIVKLPELVKSLQK